MEVNAIPVTQGNHIARVTLRSPDGAALMRAYLDAEEVDALGKKLAYIAKQTNTGGDDE